MERVLIAFDGSPGARAAVTAAAALFGAPDAIVATVRRPPLWDDADVLARVTLPEEAVRQGVTEVECRVEQDARATLEEGVRLAEQQGMRTDGVLLSAPRPWRAISALAADRTADAIVCGAHGHAPMGRGPLGSTATSLLQCAGAPVLVVPPAFAGPSDAVVVGYDGSASARRALRFVAEQLPARRTLVAYAWRSPVRHAMDLHLLHRLPGDACRDFVAALDAAYRDAAEETAREGARSAEELGTVAEPHAIESADSPWRALVHLAAKERANVIVAGSERKGEAMSALGSVRSGLVHHATTALLLVPDLPTVAAEAPGAARGTVALGG